MGDSAEIFIQFFLQEDIVAVLEANYIYFNAGIKSPRNPPVNTAPHGGQI